MSAPAWLDSTVELEARVSALIDDLTEAEQRAVAMGDFRAFIARGLPEPNYVDAGTGLRDVDGATAFPAGIALAATFDEELAREYGAAVGEEARRAGFNTVLGPTVDLARDPVGGRIGEALGEDPHLVGRMGAALVQGIQSRHVLSQVKHYIAYNGEKRRTGHGLAQRSDSMDVSADTALLQDVYLRPFEAVVRAGAWSMMGSYNRLHGEYVCESQDILEIPRRQWGWRGFYCPDFLFAIRDPQKALRAGMDLPALGGDGGRTEEMVCAVDPALVRNAVANVARALIGVGLVDNPLPTQTTPSSEAHQDLAYRTAVQGSVLLRNEGLLPLSRETSIALIGPSDEGAIHVVGGAASVTLSPERITSPRAAITALADQVRTMEGFLGDVPLPAIQAEAFTLPDGSAPGVQVEFTDGSREWTETLAQIDLTLDPFNPAQAWPKRLSTRLASDESGTHRLSLSIGGAATLRVNGRVIMAGTRETEQFISGPHYPLQAEIELTEGESADLEILFEEGPAITIPPMAIGPTLRLGWQKPGTRLDEAARSAAEVDVAIVFATMATGEGMDRDNLVLPGDQETLIRRVSAANPATLVVLNTPGAVEMDWADDVAAILQVWYPGERYGQALAAMLFGDEEPGGRLPITFPRRRSQLPGETAPGEVPERLDYNLDGGIGYRAPMIVEQGALFPFGHGLGYSTTQASVSVESAEDGSLQITVSVENLGERATTHVVQVYAQLEGETARQLVAFRRIPVEAHGTATGQFTVTPDDLARWDTELGRRRPVPGTHLLRVASDSADDGIRIPFTIPESTNRPAGA